VIVNSTVAAVLATAVTIFVHELVHLVTGIVLGHEGTLYPFGAIHDGSLTDTETALTAISAPIASLVIGAAVIAALPQPATSRFGQLFLFWLGATSFMEGAGYLVITPMGAGDTAATLAALDLPLWVGFLAAALGVALMFLGARMLAPHVVRMSGRDRTISWAIAFHPWWIGTLVSLRLTAAYLALSSADLADGDVIAILSASTALLVLGPMSSSSRTGLPTSRAP
jgi:hypothetical protein